MVNLPEECRHIVSPLKPAIWEALLLEHPDRRFVDHLMRGLSDGFRIGCRASLRNLQSVSTNMPSAILHSEVIQKYLRDEVENKRVIEMPLSMSDEIHVSRFGAIRKKCQPGRWRLIVDLSSPSECHIGILDIKSAHKNIPVHPGDRHLLGMRWQDRLFVDACLPFGLRSAPRIFNDTADALEWMIAHESRD